MINAASGHGRRPETPCGSGRTAGAGSRRRGSPERRGQTITVPPDAVGALLAPSTRHARRCPAAGRPPEHAAAELQAQVALRAPGRHSRSWRRRGRPAASGSTWSRSARNAGSCRSAQSWCPARAAWPGRARRPGGYHRATGTRATARAAARAGPAARAGHRAASRLPHRRSHRPWHRPGRTQRCRGQEPRAGRPGPGRGRCRPLRRRRAPRAPPRSPWPTPPAAGRPPSHARHREQRERAPRSADRRRAVIRREAATTSAWPNPGGGAAPSEAASRNSAASRPRHRFAGHLLLPPVPLSARRSQVVERVAERGAQGGEPVRRSGS